MEHTLFILFHVHIYEFHNNNINNNKNNHIYTQLKLNFS